MDSYSSLRGLEYKPPRWLFIIQISRNSYTKFSHDIWIEAFLKHTFVLYTKISLKNVSRIRTKFHREKIHILETAVYRSFANKAYPGIFLTNSKITEKMACLYKICTRKNVNGMSKFSFRSRLLETKNSAREPKNEVIILIFPSNLFRLHYFISLPCRAFAPVRVRGYDLTTPSRTTQISNDELMN